MHFWRSFCIRFRGPGKYARPVLPVIGLASVLEWHGCMLWCRLLWAVGWVCLSSGHATDDLGSSGVQIHINGPEASPLVWNKGAARPINRLLRAGLDQ
jgi:hypothetical protein